MCAPIRTLSTFQIPAHWKEEYEPEGGGTFFEDAPDTGTLRLNVLSFKAPQGQLPKNGFTFFSENSLEEGESVFPTEAGDGMKFSCTPSEEGGTPIDIYRWQIAHCVPPVSLHLVHFTWTILRSQSADKKFQEEIAFLHGLLIKAYFHPHLEQLAQPPHRPGRGPHQRARQRLGEWKTE